MKLDLLLDKQTATIELNTLRQRCQQFLEDSKGAPLFKNLPREYGNFHKVKVRKKKLADEFTETFNEAFEDHLPFIRQRAIFANGDISFEPSTTQTLEPFYIFPVDGYKFMYSKEVENSSHEYKQVFDTIFEQFGDDKGNEVLTELLRFTYTTDRLQEGIQSGCEIIIYGIPFYYAVRGSTISNYQKLYNEIKEDDV